MLILPYLNVNNTLTGDYISKFAIVSYSTICTYYNTYSVLILFPAVRLELESDRTAATTAEK